MNNYTGHKEQIQTHGPSTIVLNSTWQGHLLVQGFFAYVVIPGIFYHMLMR